VQLAQPGLRAHLLAPAIPYQPTTTEPANDFRDRALHALRKAGRV